MATSSEKQPSTSQSAAAEIETLTLQSSDGQEFVVPVSAAVLSGTIKNMVEEGCAGGAIPLTNVDAATLSKIVTYLNKHDAAAADELKKFDDEFVSESAGELLDVALAASYLEVRQLIDLLCLKIGHLIKNLSVEEVRELFGVDDEELLPQEQEAMIERDFDWAFQKLHLDG